MQILKQVKVVYKYKIDSLHLGSVSGTHGKDCSSELVLKTICFSLTWLNCSFCLFVCLVLFCFLVDSR